MMMPHQARYKFDFQRGKAWMNDDLVAPYDFAIYKLKDSLEAEKKQVLNTAPSFFELDSLIPLAVSSRVEERVNNLFKDSVSPGIHSSGATEKNKLLAKGQVLINDIYRKGIINSSAVPGLTEDNLIMIVQGNIIFQRHLDEFYNLKQAKEKIEKELEGNAIDPSGKLKMVLLNVLEPDILFSSDLTDKVHKQLVENISLTQGMISKGELIISRGEVVTTAKYPAIESLKIAAENNREPSRQIVIGQIMLVSIAIIVLFIFLALLRKNEFSDNRKVALLCALVLLNTFLYTWSLKANAFSMYLVPLCILPIIIRGFFDTRLALFTHVITILILGAVAPNGYELLFTQIIAGMVTIFSIESMRKRSQVFVAVGLILVTYLICYTALSIIHEGDVFHITLINFGWILGNVLLTLFSYPLIYLFEKIFKLTSDISLMELTDLNNPLLRELSMKAPGTFQHSLQVANLTESAIFRIGGNALLARVGALYHDIGKMDMPLYFIENQSTQVNPHDDLAFEESAGIIISHVIKGIEKAKKNGLPDLIIDFIRTHHGTTLVQYFYESFLKNYPDKLVDEQMFHYPGPKPFSRETAVLMMADSVEAASRSLQKHDAAAIDKLVDDIIENQVQQEQFVNCDITYRDISSIKKIFKKMLGSIYHVRIEYPQHV